MDPMTILAISAVLAGGLQGTGAIMGAGATRAAQEKETEEKAKQRRAAFMSQRKERQEASAQESRRGQREMALGKADILKSIAQNINLGAGRG